MRNTRDRGREFDRSPRQAGNPLLDADLVDSAGVLQHRFDGVCAAHPRTNEGVGLAFC